MHATQSRLKIVCPSLTNTFKTLLYSSQYLHLCTTHFENMLRLIHSYKKLQRWFTWTHLELRMRFWHYKRTFSWSPGLMDSSGTYSHQKSTQTWGNLLPPWLHYSALHIYVSQPFPTWRLFSPNPLPPWLMIIWKSAWEWLPAATVQTMPPWLWFHAVQVIKVRLWQKMYRVILCHTGSCSYAR